MSLNLAPIAVPWKRVLAVAIGATWVLAMAWWHRFVVMDDPWITFHYARNLLEGHGLAFNPGERLEGYSNLSWLLLMLPALMANLEPLGYARLLGTGCALAMLVVAAWRLPRGGTAALLLAGCYPLGVWAVGGLETTLVALLVLLLVTESARATGQHPWREGLLGGTILSLLVLSRPEGAMYAVVPGALLLVGPRESRRSHIIALCLFAAVLLVYTGWRWFYFGTIVANTVQAKVGGGALTTLWRGVVYTFGYLGGAPILLVILAALALRRHSVKRPLVVAAGAAVGIQILFSLGVGGDWMPGYRFLVPALGPLAALAVVGMERWMLPLRLSLAGLLMIAGVYQAKTEPMLNWCRWAAKDSGGVLLVEPLRLAGDELRARGNRGDLLAATEAGVLPYHARMSFLDMLGLVDAHIAALPGGLHEKYDPEYVLGRAPEYIVLGITLVDGADVGTWAPDQRLMEHPQFSERYREVQRWSRPMPPADFRGIHPGATVLYERIPPTN